MTNFETNVDCPRAGRRSHQHGAERRHRGEERRHDRARHEHGGYGRPRVRGRRGGRAGRGDVRAAIISLLNEEPSNGYQIMQDINERTSGAWRASSGSVYPAISQLEDEGLIEPTTGDGRKLYSLTQAGRDYAAQNAEQLARIWEASAADAHGTESQYRDLIDHLAAATRQVYEVGTPTQREEARTVLTRARQSLYKLLAADADEEAAEPGSDS